MKCPNCYCEVLDGIKICPCCSYVLNNSVDEKENGFPLLDMKEKAEPYESIPTVVQLSTVEHQGHIKTRSDKMADIKHDIIIIMLAVIIALEIVSMIISR